MANPKSYRLPQDTLDKLNELTRNQFAYPVFEYVSTDAKTIIHLIDKAHQEFLKQ